MINGRDRRHTLQLLNRASKPPSCTQEPQAETVSHDNPHRYDGIVERLRVDGIDLRENEDNGDEDDPEDSGHGDGERECAEVKGALCEVLTVDDSKSNGDSYMERRALM
jgi:hypothetical protein